MGKADFNLPGVDDQVLARKLRRKAVWNAFVKRRLWLTVALTGSAVGAVVLVSDLCGLTRYATFLTMFVAAFLSTLLFARRRGSAEDAEMQAALQSLGRCRTCGFDLRAQVHRRCPECGTECCETKGLRQNNL